MLSVEWREVVQYYTTLKLSFQKDRLPAVAGVAEQFRKARASIYYFGLWEDSFLQDLCWMALNPVYGLRSDRLPGVPSWSWGSVATLIHYGDMDGEPACQVIGILRFRPTQEAGGDDVTLHEVVLRGPLAPATLVYEADGQECKMKFPDRETPLLLNNDVAVGVPGPSFIPEGGTVYYMTLLPSVSLVLQLLDQSTALYQRVGIFQHFRSFGALFEDEWAFRKMHGYPEGEEKTVRVI